MTLNINLPDDLTRQLEQRAAKLGYKDASEYVAAIIEADHFRQVQKEIEEMIEEAIDGPFEEWTEKDVEDIRRVGQRVIQRRKTR